MNGPKVQVAVAAPVAAAIPQSSVPQTTNMTPVAIKTALSALHVPGQRQQSGREVKLISPLTNTPPKTQVVNGPLQQTNSIQQTVVVSSTLATSVPTTIISTPRTLSTIQQTSSVTPATPTTTTPCIPQRTIVSVASTTPVTATIVNSSTPAAGSTPKTTATPTTTAASQNSSQNKTPNFRAILDRFDNLSGVSLNPPSFQDCPMKFHVIDGPLKPPNVLIRNPKKLPAAPSTLPSITRSPGKSNFPSMPPDPTRGKISSDLLRRLKEEVDNRCVLTPPAPIVQDFAFDSTLESIPLLDESTRFS